MNEASRGNDFTTSNLKHLAGAVFLIALSVRLVAAWKTGFFRDFEPSEMVRIALSLTRNQGYGNPFLIPTGPTAHEMPLYPMFMSVIYRVFGIGARAEAVKIALACTISAFRCALIPLFCLAINLGRRVAITAAIVSSFYITSLQTEVRGNWDGPWQTLALLILTWMTIRIWSSRSWMERTNFGYFILWGVTILLQPAFLPILAAFMLAGLVACRNEARGRYLKQCSVLVLVVAAFLAPWVIRNDLQFGKMVITRDNFGLEFWVSNGPGRAFDADNNIVHHPSSSMSEAQEVLRLGEIQYNQMKLTEAKVWVKANLRTFAHMTAVRFAAFWFPLTRSSVHSILSIAFSLFGLIGLGLLFRVQPLAATLFALAWLSFPLVYYVIQSSSRYRYPLDWQLLICASLTFDSILNLLTKAI